MTKKNYCVYRYIDLIDNKIKYVGIVHKGDINGRMTVHKQDKWVNDGVWKVQYFECENRSEVEAFESHLIALYQTYKYYNKAKKNWGLNKYLPDVEDRWKDLTEEKYSDLETKLFILRIRKLIRAGHGKDIISLLDCLDFEKV